jgi:NAD(P)-dependent dehydrogenase (short-subunit alcohol dehydrogenase family)
MTAQKPSNVTILTTGAARGSGRALCLDALWRSWDVIGSVRDPETAKALASELGPRFRALVFDVTDAAAVAKAAASLDRPIDILINNAGIIGPDRQSALDMDFDGLRQTLEVNTLAPLRVTQAFLPHLRRSAKPRVLTISSNMGSLSYAKSDHLAYRISKAAVNKAMQGLATDLKRQGVAVAVLHPGWVRTDMGGAVADISPEASAKGILDLGEGLTLGGSGRFLNYDGREMAW